MRHWTAFEISTLSILYSVDTIESNEKFIVGQHNVEADYAKNEHDHLVSGRRRSQHSLYPQRLRHDHRDDSQCLPGQAATNSKNNWTTHILYLFTMTFQEKTSLQSFSFELATHWLLKDDKSTSLRSSRGNRTLFQLYNLVLLGFRVPFRWYWCLISRMSQI